MMLFPPGWVYSVSWILAMGREQMTAFRKVAIVTGAGTGIGKATALALLREGYCVALAGRRAEFLERTVKEAGPLAPQALAVPTDVRDPVAVGPCSARPGKPLAGSTCCLTMRGSSRRRSLWKISPTSNGSRPRHQPDRCLSVYAGSLQAHEESDP